MSEIITTGSLKGFDYEVFRDFVDIRAGEKAKLSIILIIKKNGKTVLDTFWEGWYPEAYIKMIALDEVSWFISNQDIFTQHTIRQNKNTCGHLIKAELYKGDDHLQSNALRIETINICDRCALKMPMHWNENSRGLAYIDIMNGNILDFGVCGDGPCPCAEVE